MSNRSSKLLVVPALFLALSCGQSQSNTQQGNANVSGQAASAKTEQAASSVSTTDHSGNNPSSTQHIQTGPAPAIPDFTFYVLKSGIRFEKTDLPADQKHVFILFDPSCSYCQHEARDIGKNIDKFKNTNFYFISMNDPALMNTFFDRFSKELNNRSNVHMLYDRNVDFINKFHMPSQYPATYIYDHAGLLTTYWNGIKSEAELVQNILK